jgi:hypothetical protein
MQSTTRWCLNEGSMGDCAELFGGSTIPIPSTSEVIYNTCGVVFRDPLAAANSGRSG